MTKDSVDNSLSSTVYGFITDDEDARVCKDIPDSACNDQPKNFLVHLISLSFTKIGDKLIDQKLVLAWLLNVLGAPALCISLLVPIRESFALLPQLAIARLIRAMSIRKYLWCFGAVMQGLSVLGFALAALNLKGAAAGWTIIALLVVFSLSRGICSVSHKDVLGKTVSKTRRGRVSGFAESIAGLVTIVLALWLLLGEGRSVPLIAAFLFIAAALWMLAAALYSQLNEQAGATEGGGNALTEAVKQFAVIGKDKAFRQFVIARSCLLGSALLAPYIVISAQSNSEENLTGLGALLLAASFASFLSGPVWGKFSDKSSCFTMAIAGLISGAVGIFVFFMDKLVSGSENKNLAFVYIAAIFFLYLAHSGIRIGRKTHLVDMASKDNRATYVAVSNTFIGVMLLFSVLIAWMSNAILQNGALLVFSCCAIVGAVLSWGLPQVQKN